MKMYKVMIFFKLLMILLAEAANLLRGFFGEVWGNGTEKAFYRPYESGTFFSNILCALYSTLALKSEQ